MTPPATPKVHVLVVEDEVMIGLVTAMSLTRMGCHVLGPVTSLSSAMEIAELNRIDAAVLDFDIGGRPVSPLARMLDERKTPYLICTGTPERALEDLPGAAERILEKPVFGSLLEERFNRLFNDN